MNESRHLIPLSRIALLVATGDLLTKAAAKAFLAHDPTRFAPWLHFAVVHNDRGAFGWSVGVYTWQLNLALTLAAIVFMIPVTRDLSRIDPAAPRALGLIVGGALGNLASLLTSPAGVVDFIAISFETRGVVLNVADVAAYAGLAMILRTGVLITVAMRRETRVEDGRRRSVLPTVFAEQAMLRDAMAKGKQRPRRHSRETDVAIVDWNDMTNHPALVADAPRRREPSAEALRPRDRARAPDATRRALAPGAGANGDVDGDSPTRRG